ncbi:filamentous hemagglutinin N-terminal domain-containing protein [Salmonella enterica subsp. enterica serovar Aqua]|nr:filamentous hemagglutinin N-terminal domain-containing protein [Salmonella enterica subsp. enterica serovar Aqua]
MNKIYRLKFDKRRNELVVVSEITTGMGKEKSTGHIAALSDISTFRKLLGTLTPLALLTGLVISLFPGMVLANPDLPTGGQIVGGQGSISSSGSQMTIHQQTQNMVTDWHSFDIGKNNTVQFVQPDSSSVALNRVTGASGSQIMGTLTANGQVFILNPNGVLFGKDARVNVAGLVASTKNINTADFMKGQYTLSGEGNPGAQVVNQGSLTTSKGGYIVLAGERVSNSGTVTTPGGKTVLAAGKTVTLQLDNGGLTSVSVDGSVVNALVENRGLISATNGQVYLTAKGKDMLLNTVVNNSGTIEAKGLESRGGEIVLNGGDSGVVSQSGTLLADSQTGQGGKVILEGQNIHLAGNSLTSAAGKTGGGEVYVGGGWQGKDSRIRNASKVVMDKTATVDVSATETGNGGTAVLWSDDYTNFRGTVLAKGGAQSGNGGRVETSSHKNLQAFGDVDTSASSGKGGDWLLDPLDVTIVSDNDNTKVTESGLGTEAKLDEDNSHVFSPSASGAKVSAGKIQEQLNKGTNVTVDTHGNGTELGNITIAQNVNITKNSEANNANDVTLILHADNNIEAKDNVSISATHGKLNLHLLAGSITSNASITLGKKVNISLNGGDFLAEAGNKSNRISLKNVSGGRIHGNNVTLNVAQGISGYAYSVQADNNLTINGPVFGSTSDNHLLSFLAGNNLVMSAPDAITLQGNNGFVRISGNKSVSINVASGRMIITAQSPNGVNITSSEGAVNISSTVQNGTNAMLLTNVNISSKGSATLNGTSYWGQAVMLSGVNLTATGDVNISGQAKNLTTGDLGTGASLGLIMTNSNITTTSGNLTLTGVAGTAVALPQNSLEISNSTLSASKAAITLNGTAINKAGVKVSNSNITATSLNVKGVSTKQGTGFSLTNTHLKGGLNDLSNVTFSSAGSAAGVTNLLDSSIVTASNKAHLMKWHPDNMTVLDMGGQSIFDDTSNDTKGWTANYSHSDNPNGGWIFNHAKVTAAGTVNLTGASFTNSTINVSSGDLTIANTGPTPLDGTNISVSTGNVSINSSAGSISLYKGNISAGKDITLIANNPSTGMVTGINLSGVNLNATNGNVTINGTTPGTFSGVRMQSVNITANKNTGVVSIYGSSTGINNTWDEGGSIHISGKNSIVAHNTTITGENKRKVVTGGIGIAFEGANISFTGNASILGTGTGGGVDFRFYPSTLNFNNGTATLTGKETGPGVFAYGSGGIRKTNWSEQGDITVKINLNNANVSVIGDASETQGNGMPGFDLSNSTSAAKRVKNGMIFAGVGNATVIGKATDGNGVDLGLFDNTSLNGKLSVEGTSIGGAGVYVGGKLNITLNNASITGCSTTGQGVVFSGIPGAGSDIKFNNSTILGTSTKGTGVKVERNLPLVLNGTSNLQGNSVTGTGVSLGASVTGSGSITGMSTSGDGLVLANNAIVKTVTLSGTSNNGNGVRLTGNNVKLDEAVVNKMKASSTDGSGLMLNDGASVHVVQSSDMSTPVQTAAVVSGLSTNGSAVTVEGNASVSGLILSGNTSTSKGAGVTLKNGKLTLADNISGVDAKASGGGTALILDDAEMDAQGYRESSSGEKDYELNVSVDNDNSTAVKGSGNSKLTSVKLKADAKKNGTGLKVENGTLTSDRVITATTEGQQGTALLLSGGSLQGNSDTPVMVEVSTSKEGSGTAVKVEKAESSEGVETPSSLKNIDLHASSEMGTALNVGGELNSDHNINASTNNGTALLLNGGGLSSADKDQHVTIIASALGDKGSAVTVAKNNEEGSAPQSSSLKNIILDSTSTKGNALNVEGKLETQNADLKVKATDTGTALNVNGGEVHSLGQTTLTANAETGHAAVIKEGKLTGEENGEAPEKDKPLVLTVTTSSGNPALDISGSSDIGHVSINAENKGTTGPAVMQSGETKIESADVSGKATSGTGVEVNGHVTLTNASVDGTTVSGTGTQVAKDAKVTSDDKSSLSGEASGTGKGTNVSGEFSGGKVGGSATTGSALVLADGAKVENAEVSGKATSGTGVEVNGHVTLTNASVDGMTEIGKGAIISGTLTQEGTGSVSGHAEGNGTGMLLNSSANVSGGTLTGASVDGVGLQAETGSKGNNVKINAWTANGKAIAGENNALTTTGNTSITTVGEPGNTNISGSVKPAPGGVPSGPVAEALTEKLEKIIASLQNEMDTKLADLGELQQAMADLQTQFDMSVHNGSIVQADQTRLEIAMKGLRDSLNSAVELKDAFNVLKEGAGSPDERLVMADSIKAKLQVLMLPATGDIDDLVSQLRKASTAYEQLFDIVQKQESVNTQTLLQSQESQDGFHAGGEQRVPVRGYQAKPQDVDIQLCDSEGCRLMTLDAGKPSQGQEAATSTSH